MNRSPIQHSRRQPWWRLRLRPNREGFTLVEIMMVLMILAIGILPLAIVQTRARQEVNEADVFTQAITVAQEQLEQMKGEGFGNAAPDSGAVGGIMWRTGVEVIGIGMERITVTVAWANSDGPQSLVMADLMSMR